MKKLLNFLVLTVLSVVLAVVFLHLHLRSESSMLIHNDLSELQPAKTAIVLGASVRPDGSLSPVLLDRVQRAHEVYKAGKVDNFLLTGDGRGPQYDEVNAMRKYLKSLGVPDSNIKSDSLGLDTYDSMRRALTEHQVTDAVVVTQKYHLPRAIYLAKNLGISAQGFSADQRKYKDISRYQRREWLANVKAWMEINLKAEPAGTD